MIGRVVVMEPAAYQAWLAGRRRADPRSPTAAAGERLFPSAGCVDLPQARDSAARAGRASRGLFGSTVHARATASTVVADEAYLRESILNPARQGRRRAISRVMPTFQGLS